MTLPNPVLGSWQLLTRIPEGFCFHVFRANPFSTTMLATCMERDGLARRLVSLQEDEMRAFICMFPRKSGDFLHPRSDLSGNVLTFKHGQPTSARPANP